MQDEPIMDVAHLGHLELLTPTPEESRAFFVDVLGMTESGRSGNSVYLRGWDDYERYSLKLTASKPPAWPCGASGAEPAGAGAPGRGAEGGRLRDRLDRRRSRPWPGVSLPRSRRPSPRALLRDRVVPAAGRLKPALKNQAQRFPARGVNVRRLDHLNCLAVDIKANRIFFETYLGCRLTEQIVLDDGTEAAMWMTCTNKSYDFAYTREAHSGTPGRFHHVTFALDSREDILRAADIFLENGVFIETGPHKHAIQQTFFLYVYEPGGNRVEVANAGRAAVLAPDWKPIVWTEEERKKGQAWGLKTIESFHTHGTPPLPGEPPAPAPANEAAETKKGVSS